LPPVFPFVNSSSGGDNFFPPGFHFVNSRPIDDNFFNFFNESLRNYHLADSSMDNPVDNDVLTALPEFQIEDVNKLPQEKRDCVVCLTKYENNDKAIILPCTHLFHSDCIKDWFNKQNTCPICKFKIDRNSIN